MTVEVFPRIVKAGRSTEITVRLPINYDKSEHLELILIPADGGEVYKKNFNVNKNKITAAFSFLKEMEYILLIKSKAVDTSFRLYALKKDLFCLKPLKGDLHMHTNLSDGEDTPAFVAASSREIGMDFIAITDHYKYEPSIEAIEAFRDVKTGLTIFNGEEIHPPHNRVHMINFGGKESINKMFEGKEYSEGVKEIEKSVDRKLPDKVRHSCASCVWCFNKIREIGGTGVFCHPHWFVHNKYDIDERITEYLFRIRCFDVLELIGGYHKYETESNALTVSYWAERQIKYGKIPVVGSSDEHGVTNGKLFGWYYTVAFAESNIYDDIAEAIKDMRTVAVEALPGEAVHVYGRYRLVKYAYFLIREYFPARDKICRKEGSLLKAYIESKKGIEKIAKVSAEAENFRRSYFAGFKKGKEAR